MSGLDRTLSRPYHALMLHSACRVFSQPLSRRLCGVWLALSLLLALPRGANAQAPDWLRLPVLVPLEAISLELLGFSQVLTAEPAEGGTLIRGEQRYVLYNGSNETASATLRLALPDGRLFEQVTVAIDTIVQEMDAGALGTVSVSLSAGQTDEIAVAYQVALPDGMLLAWTWDSADLAPWGEVPPTRLALRYPDGITDEALLDASPAGYGLEGGEVIWDLDAAAPVQVVAVAPEPWREIIGLRMAQDWGGLGLFYLELADEMADLGLEADAFYAAGIGELLAGIGREAEPAPLRAVLADVYAARAAAAPERRLPYLSLGIEQLEAVEPANRTAAMTERLGELSLEAALAAEESGNPALALDLLQKAEGILGGDLVDQRQEALALRLALSLAERGRLQQALEAIEGEISPQTRDSLLRYAPPFASVVTTVTVGSEMRTSEQAFRLYPPTADTTLLALEEISARLEATGLMTASLTRKGEMAVLTVVGPHRATLEASEGDEELAYLSDPNDLLSAVVRSSWGQQAQAFTREQNLWRTIIRYQETVDLEELGTLWAAEDSLVQWQAIEIEAALAPESEPSYEQRLAYHALAEQRDIWRDLPRGSYWVYQLALDEGDALYPVGRVPFGQSGRPTSVLVRYHRDRVAVAALAGLALVVALLAAVAGAGRRSRDGRLS